eukprot:scaffold143630_cov22-Prasinocladus_malaysianus.AAC.1
MAYRNKPTMVIAADAQASKVLMRRRHKHMDDLSLRVHYLYLTSVHFSLKSLFGLFVVVDYCPSEAN